MTLLVVAIAGAFGAPARYLLERGITARLGRGFPWGTFVVNVSGSLLLGMVAGSTLHGLPRAAVATGFLGAYTTFSGYAFEVVDREVPRARVTYAWVSIVASTAAAWLGLLVTG